MERCILVERNNLFVGVDGVRVGTVMAVVAVLLDGAALLELLVGLITLGLIVWGRF